MSVSLNVLTKVEYRAFMRIDILSVPNNVDIMHSGQPRLLLFGKEEKSPYL